MYYILYIEGEAEGMAGEGEKEAETECNISQCNCALLNRVTKTTRLNTGKNSARTY